MDYKITVYCLAYNHGNYIRNTLEGFVNQKTNFKFKVIVHDDASTDNTAEIIAEYAKKYPDIIFPIYQKENQYSKGIKIYPTYIEPLIDTEFGAICEGDDYWTDENKLQIQYDYMISHPECSLCVHNTDRISVFGENLNRKYNPNTEGVDYTSNDVIRVKGGGLFHTSSYLYRFADRKAMPEEFKIKGIGDYPLAIYLSTIGTVHYIPKIMSAYRMGTPGSWTQRQLQNREKRITHIENVIVSLARMNDFTGRKYENAFIEAIEKYKFDLLLITPRFLPIIKDKSMRKIFNTLPIIQRIKYLAKTILKRK